MRIKYLPLIIILFLGFGVSSLYGMDVDLWNLPYPPASELVWKDKPVEINGINARGTHLRSSLNTEEIIDFYQQALIKNNWQLKDNFLAQKVLAFTRQNKFIYLAVQDNGKDAPSDVYIVSSPSDLALCKILATYMQKGLMQQDALGKDVADIPRYPASKRMISIFAPDEGTILLYQIKGSPQEIAQFYRQQLKANGWQIVQDLSSPLPLIPRAAAQISKMNVDVLLYTKENNTLLVSISPISEERIEKHCVVVIAKNMLEEFAYPAGEVK